jgi:translation initiation factor IF-1
MQTKKTVSKRSLAFEKRHRERKDNPDVIRVMGEVLENLPNTLFRVRLEEKFGSKEIICYLSGRMRKNYIKILPGDIVEMEVSKYDPNKGRIVYRK